MFEQLVLNAHALVKISSPTTFRAASVVSSIMLSGATFSVNLCLYIGRYRRPGSWQATQYLANAP
jgi:hypothetical protein